MRLITIILLLVLISVFGCISSDYEGDYPTSPMQPVLNALLAADSTFQVRLSWPATVSGKAEFAPIENAQVLLFENDKVLGFAGNVGNGLYRLDSTARQGNTYRVEVAIPGWPVLNASTVIPVEPTLVVKRSYDKETHFDNYEVEMGKPLETISGVWIYVNGLEDGALVQQSNMLMCNSSLCDSFNRTNYSSGYFGYVFGYDYFIRIQAPLLAFDKNTLALSPFIAYDQSVFTAIYASADYDNYFRTLFLQKYWSPKTDLPFTYQPIMVKGNVTNGLGVFAGYNVTTVVFN